MANTSDKKAQPKTSAPAKSEPSKSSASSSTSASKASSSKPASTASSAGRSSRSRNESVAFLLTITGVLIVPMAQAVTLVDGVLSQARAAARP